MATANRMTDAEGVALLNLSLAYGLEQLVEFDTCIGPHGTSRLDLFLTDHLDSVSVESYLFATDHVAVIARGNNFTCKARADHQAV